MTKSEDRDFFVPAITKMTIPVFVVRPEAYVSTSTPLNLLLFRIFRTISAVPVITVFDCLGNKRSIL